MTSTNFRSKLSKKEKQLRYDEAYNYLRDLLEEQAEIYTIVTSVSSSGMSRRIKFFAAKNYEIIPISFHIADLLDSPYNYDGVKCDGCGMDIAWHSVYQVSKILFDD